MDERNGRNIRGLEPQEGTIYLVGTGLHIVIPQYIVKKLDLVTGDKVLKTFDPVNSRIIVEFLGKKPDLKEIINHEV